MKFITDNPMATEHLWIRNAELRDLPTLEFLCTLWTDKGDLEGHGFDPDYMDKTFHHKDLPPIENASPEAHRLKVFCLKETQEIIGFLELYHGYAHEDMLWIGMFFMHPDHQKNGYGSEVLNVLEGEAIKQEYTHMGLGVYLKNWKGLRFWHHNGFNVIRGIYGDKEYSDNTFALMGLEKPLKSSMKLK